MTLLEHEIAEEIAARMNALNDAVFEVIVRTGNVPKSRYDIPPDISFRLVRSIRRNARTRSEGDKG